MTASLAPRRSLGERGERLAAEHLERAGYTILATNFRTRFGELDLVAVDHRRLVFCEVETRTAAPRRAPAGPLDAIGPRKRAQVRAMAREWLLGRASAGGPRRPERRLRAVGSPPSRR